MIAEAETAILEIEYAKQHRAGFSSRMREIVSPTSFGLIDNPFPIKSGFVSSNSK